MSRIELPPNPRILVIALRRLGDVLLTTPLIRSLRRTWPQAAIDALVFADTAGILEGNPDLDTILTMPARPSSGQSLLLAAQLWRRYALAISTQSGDRPIFFSWIAGRARIGPAREDFGGRLKKLAMQRSIAVSRGVHRVEEMLRLADLLGVPRVPELVAPAAAVSPLVPGVGYAVIHAAPMFRYKQWTVAGWRALAAALERRGLFVIATGGPTEVERRYLDQVWRGVQVRRLDGRLDWREMTGLLVKARVYVGPDTSVTHLATAVGCPTVALYGPTDPRLWGPWPMGGLDTMWAADGSIQRRGNVWLVQHAFSCVPCQLEGCERQPNSGSRCLEELSSRQVIAAVDQALS